MALTVIERPHLSSEPIRVPVHASVNGLPFNPTSMTVEMAFVLDSTGGDPASWTVGTWDIDTTSTSSVVYKAQVKPPNLAIGTYTVWLRITGTDVPVRIVGILKLV
jgi:hypothetical protein